ncbi:MAG: serine/threonine protein phosphatase [Oscillospiraceae bacterium]|jgi:protein phosphatase|nr:serine/threonine protein phosphatase [Oscillospiraceae bacterium]
MNAVIQRVSFPKGRRVVAVSDIHGCLDVFKALLKKVSFCPDDILVLVGDVLEKGTQSLETIRFLLGLSQTHTVYKVVGNVDILYEDIFEDFTRENGETLMSYLLRRDRAQGILHQMSREIDFPINETMDLVRWRKALLDRFPQELNFLRGWPHILESEKLIFVHAGLTAAPLEEQQAWQCRKNDDFMAQGLSFPKMVVVGHWPVSIYGRDNLVNQNPCVSREQNICSIDGGMAIKHYGQLNALIMQDGDPEQMSFVYESPFPWVTALDAQEESVEPVSIVWGRDRQLVEKLDHMGDFTLCRQIATGRTLWVSDGMLYMDGKGRLCSGDETDFHPAVRPGDRFQLLEETSRGYRVLFQGILGWYGGRIRR